MRRTAIFFLIAALVSVAFLLGSEFGKVRLGKTMDLGSAIVRYYHYNNYKKLERDIAEDCAEKSLVRLESLIDTELMHMAEYFQSAMKNESSARRRQFEIYIDTREDGLLSKLAEYEVDWGKEYKIPVC